MKEDSGFRVFVFMDEDFFIGHCLEHDILVQAYDLKTLKDRMRDTLAVELKYAKETGTVIPPAQDYVQEQWSLNEPSYILSRNDVRQEMKNAWSSRH